MDSTSDKGASTSTRPYLIRALHDWCTDNGFTPYIAVHVDRMVQVPMEYVSNNEIVLNVGFDATSGLELGNDFIQFKARFGGVAREILVPVDHVVAIYARENGQGMAFPAPNVESMPEAAAPAGAAPRGGVTPLRGLRLASTPEPEAPATPAPAPAPKAKVEEAKPKADGNDGGDDEPAGPASGGRPALKRIK
ncbi:ClpXP protease specificity-enhancing factor [Pelomonas sp. V22]|uniref:ClpXP protease specificity-enhancing factor n=1 Tax=Pelomonas sp. V22 TaxID=2822139 RepID=UPI0024A7A7BB|nr:ClpXP protease specificity-enhancing factor [Pelomonas sp. V22]MDI4635254.1 ClpXP protease specificity-enhancing factor [Pelomonas sp. V22]